MKIKHPYFYQIDDKDKLLEMLNYFYKEKYSSIIIDGSNIVFYEKPDKSDYFIQWDITAFCIMYLLAEIQRIMPNPQWDGGKLLDSYVTGSRLNLGNPIEFLYTRFKDNKE